MTEYYRDQLLTICQALFEADADEGISTDELMMATGLTPEAVRDALYDLEGLGIARNDSALTIEDPIAGGRAETGGTWWTPAVWSPSSCREASKLWPECGVFPPPFWRSSIGNGQSQSHSTGAVSAVRPGTKKCWSWRSSRKPAHEPKNNHLFQSIRLGLL